MTTSDQEPGAVLEGEILPAPIPVGEYTDPPRAHRTWRADLSEDDIRNLINERLIGYSLRQIGEKYHVSPQTVKRWTDGHVKSREYAPVDIVAVRARMAAEMEAAEAVVERIIRLTGLAQHGSLAVSDKLAKVALDAVAQLNALKTNRARLLGAVAPVRVDAVVTKLTAAEAELQEMINEAKAREHQREADVIAQASADEDL